MRLAPWIAPTALALVTLAASTPPASATPPPALTVEPVLVLNTFGTDLVAVQRANNEVWILRYGIGCISLWLYDGRTVLISSPAGFFAGIGSSILIPDRGQSCRIWERTKLGRIC